MKITRRSDGRYTVPVNLGRGRRKFVYGTTAEEAKRKAIQLAAAHLEGKTIPSAKESLGAFLDRWIAFVKNEGRVRPRTLQGWENYCRIYLKPALGSIPLAKLTAADVAEFLAERKARPSTDGRKHRTAKQLSASTMRNALRVLRTALKQAKRWKLVTENVASTENVDAPRGSPREARHISPEELRRLRDVLHHDRLGALFLLMGLTGLRPSEAYGLRWQDLDLEAGVLHVRHSLDFEIVERLDEATGRPRKSRRYFLGELKTPESRRDLRLPQEAISALRRHRAGQSQERLAWAQEWRATPIGGLVFTTRTGRPLDDAHVRRSLRLLLERAGLPPATPYSFRHGFASSALAAGVDLKLVSAQLGHSQIGTTADVYAHVDAEGMRLVSEKVAALIFGREHA